LEGSEAMGSMTRATSQARQTFAHGSIEAFDERRIQFDSSSGER
jgi:hypothetical protein